MRRGALRCALRCPVPRTLANPRALRLYRARSQVWYYPCVDSLPLWLCFELLRPLLRTVPTSSAAEQVLERMYAALELARISDSDSSEEGGRDSATSMLRGAVVQGHLAEVEEVKQVQVRRRNVCAGSGVFAVRVSHAVVPCSQVTPPAPPSPVVSEVSSPKAVTAKVEEQVRPGACDTRGAELVWLTHHPTLHAPPPERSRRWLHSSGMWQRSSRWSCRTSETCSRSWHRPTAPTAATRSS